MKNKKAQLFSLYLVFITFFFIGLVIFAYIENQKTINTSIVSPIEILLIEDEKQIFEYNEETLIKEMYCNQKITENFKQEFCQRIHPFSSFLQKNLYYNNQKVPESSLIETTSWNNFCENIYNFELNENKIKFSREKLIKRLILKSNDSQFQKITFNTYLDYSYSKEEIINC